MSPWARASSFALLLGLLVPAAAVAQSPGDWPEEEIPSAPDDEPAEQGEAPSDAPPDASAEEPQGYGGEGQDGEGQGGEEQGGEEQGGEEQGDEEQGGEEQGDEEQGDGDEQDTPQGEAPSPHETAEQAVDAEESRLHAIVIDAATYGIDPVVGRHVSSRMRRTLEEMGYHVLTADESVAAAQKLRMPYPPSPADLWRVTWAAEAHRGAFARVWAHQGRYVIEITVASLDGTGPFFARGTSGASDLHDVVKRLTEQAMPPRDVWSPEEYERLTQRRGTERPQPEQPERPEQPQPPPEGEAPEPSFEQPERGGPVVPETEPEEPEEPLRRWSLALQTEAAVGTTQDGFYNHLVGGRLDFRITREILLGAYVGYTNLRGKDGRVHNLLAYGQLEHRVRLTPRSDITIPLRFAVGYLPFNGPVIRLAAGVNIPLGDRVELHFDILTPTFWVLPDGTAVSLNGAIELSFRL